MTLVHRLLCSQIGILAVTLVHWVSATGNGPSTERQPKPTVTSSTTLQTRSTITDDSSLAQAVSQLDHLLKHKLDTKLEAEDLYEETDAELRAAIENGKIGQQELKRLHVRKRRARKQLDAAEVDVDYVRWKLAEAKLAKAQAHSRDIQQQSLDALQQELDALRRNVSRNRRNGKGLEIGWYQVTPSSEYDDLPIPIQAMAAGSWLAGQVSSLENAAGLQLSSAEDNINGYDDGGGYDSKKWRWTIGLIILAVLVLAVVLVVFALPRGIKQKRHTDTSERSSSVCV